MAISRQAVKKGREAAMILAGFLVKICKNRKEAFSLSPDPNSLHSINDTWGLYNLNTKIILSMIDKMSEDVIAEIKRSEVKKSRIKRTRRTHAKL